jgi:uracil-DNA glycosylase
MINDNLKCDFPCSDVGHSFILPHLDINPRYIRIMMISEAPPIKKEDYYYSKDNTSSFDNTTCTAFRDAGIEAKDIFELLSKGIYFTTAIKCSKKDYLVSTETLKNCAIKILKEEMSQFLNLKVIMCMGDFAIKCVNYLMKAQTGKNVIPPGSTYKIRSVNYITGSILYIPSYTQTGDSFNIEKSKRRMIAEDIRRAMAYIAEGK